MDAALIITADWDALQLLAGWLITACMPWDATSPLLGA
jgi:hypothetical protein